MSDYHYTANEYQQDASRTLIDTPPFTLTDHETMVLWNVTGLAGEVGEVCDIVKKVIFHRHDTSKLTDSAMRKELGDVCWYLAALCSHLDMDLGDIMAENIEKLKKRFPDGYKQEDTIVRRDLL